MRNDDPEDMEYPQDLRGIKKPKSFNKKKGEKDRRISTPGYQAPIQISPNDVEIDPDMQDQAENQYLAPVRIDPEMEVNISQDQSEMEDTDDPDYRLFLQPDARNEEETQQERRRSSRIPKLSAKALENFQYDQ